MTNNQGGFQARNTPAERRAFFDANRCCTDLKARVGVLEEAAESARPAGPIASNPIFTPPDYQIYTDQQIGYLRTEMLDEIAALRTEMLAAISDLRDEVYYTRRFRAFWQYSNTTTSPPGAGQVRTNVPITTMYIAKIDSDGYDRSIQLDYVPHGTLIRVRGTTGNVFELRATGPSTDHGTWFDVPVTVVSGTALDKGFRIELTMFTGIWSEDEPT